MPCIENAGRLASFLCTGKSVGTGSRINAMRGSCTNLLCQIFPISISLEASLVS